MTSYMKRQRRSVALVAAFSMLLPSASPSIAIGAGQSQVPSKPSPGTKPATPAQAPPTTDPAAPPAAKPAAADPSADAVVVDGGWPRMYDVPGGGSVLVYQPQIASWKGQKHMVAYSAVSYRSKAGDKPALGTIRVESETAVSLEDRLVRFAPMKIVEANFQTLPKEQVRDVVAVIDQAIPDEDRIIALDRILVNLDKSEIVPKQVEGLKADPPTVFFSKTPAVIVNVDGDPIWSPIRENDLKFAVNTNWDLFQHTPTNSYYLRHNDGWLKTSDLKARWEPAGKLPDSFGKLPADENWNEVKVNLPGKPVKAVPQVFVSFEPAELILLTGEPSYVLVPGTDLLWVNNTESDVFRVGRTGPVYYLVSGRWFSAADFTGPWKFATPSLPESFKAIPLEHPRSRVLASVPGTDQAAEAVLLASIPQTARVNKKELKAPEVDFQGEPQFAAVEKTTVQRAVNTDKDILKVGDAYYMCYQGVWFVGKSAAGPWSVAESVPSQIYEIPVSSPAHHVTYVTIEEDDDDDWVVYAAAAGYTGMMIGWGCTMWGTGWYYPPYWGWGGSYPYYYPHFPTYGYSAWYNPWTGGYGRTAAVYGPYGGAGVGARYNPRTGTYARGAAAWGPYGARGVAHAYNPRTGAYGATRQGSNVYGSWGSTAVQRGDDWARTNRYTNRQSGTTTRSIRTDDGSAVTRRGAGGGTVGVGDGGNVYAGRDGNVYRRQDGTWQKHENGGWSDTARQPERPAPSERPTTADRSTNPTRDPSTVDRSTADQLDRDSAARREGSQRTKDYGSYRSAPSSRGGGSYRGGGSRGGGGRRR